MIDYRMVTDELLCAIIKEKGTDNTIQFLKSIGLNEREIIELGFNELKVGNFFKRDMF